MKLFIGVVLLYLAVVTYGKNASLEVSDRIVGGQDAAEGAYKYQVSLRIAGSHFCGGSIINKRWILTAAHCVKSVGDNPVQVVAGTNLLQGGDEQAYESDYATYHKDYTKAGFQNDIGLIHVSKDIAFNDKVQPIALPKTESYKAGDDAILTGWGLTAESGNQPPNNLQEVHLKLYDQGQCQTEVANMAEISNSQICTFTEEGQGACKGDSGGPLVSGGVQVGIVSFGKPCAEGVPDVFTRVFQFRDWIAAQQASQS